LLIGYRKPVFDDIDLLILNEQLNIDPFDVYNLCQSEIKLDCDAADLRGQGKQNKILDNCLINTNFSLITETTYGPNVLFVTEKTYKTVFYGHPFMVYGNTNILNYLKSVGYETFSEMFDESYDLMTESFEKYNFISNQIKFYTTDEGKKKLERLLPILRSTLEYNRNHLLSLSSNDVWNSLEDLYKNN
jgi:hypothetical protein